MLRLAVVTRMQSSSSSSSKRLCHLFVVEDGAEAPSREGEITAISLLQETSSSNGRNMDIVFGFFCELGVDEEPGAPDGTVAV